MRDCRAEVHPGVPAEETRQHEQASPWVSCCRPMLPIPPRISPPPSAGKETGNRSAGAGDLLPGNRAEGPTVPSIRCRVLHRRDRGSGIMRSNRPFPAHGYPMQASVRRSGFLRAVPAEQTRWGRSVFARCRPGVLPISSRKGDIDELNFPTH